MNPFTQRVLFLVFFLSGFSSLMYQVVWTRLAFASFGIITPVLSVVISVFMLGLALGSWAGGRWIGPLTTRTGRSAVSFYAAAELVIGLGAFVVPKLFTAGENLLLASGETDSFHYLALSALVLAAAILPWCICMGTTFPFMMAYMRELDAGQSKSFSFLYLANVLGAMSGTLLSAVVYIELFGFHHTLWLAAAGNFAVAFVSICLGLAPKRVVKPAQPAAAGDGEPTTAPASSAVSADGTIKWILFSTGFISLAMEVSWTRAFTPVLKTQVYSFALIVFTYLGATFAGSWIYRRDLLAGRKKSRAVLMAALAVTVFFPILVNSPLILNEDYHAPFMSWWSALVLLACIVPFCGLLGYLTPGLVDEYATGNPAQAGRAYAINVLGCILGPLIACYVLLPRLSERHTLILLALPLLIFCFLYHREYSPRFARGLAAMIVAAGGWAAFGTQDFDTLARKMTFVPIEIRRDHVATVISVGQGPGTASLLVNGIGMTTLTPITKYMVHLPMAIHKEPPKSVLVICFGMGTSYRSAMSWGVDTTAVELVPSVPKAFGFYHADAARILNETNGHVIVDDGRRFLKRTDKKFDVIVVDPPPPVQAAGSSLLFSREFYQLAAQHLNPGGIVQMWYPGKLQEPTAKAVLRSMCDAFPHVRCFVSVEGWGMHMLGSTEPMEQANYHELVARMPESARQDLVEWFGTNKAPAALNTVLKKEFLPSQVLDPDTALAVTDDQPFNEYFIIRRLLGDGKKGF